MFMKKKNLYNQKIKNEVVQLIAIRRIEAETGRNYE